MSAWVIGNWKLNPAKIQQAIELVDAINKKSASISGCNLAVAPSMLHVTAVSQCLSDSKIQLACQDVSALSAQTGAFTGDTSAVQLQNAGVDWVIIGHSERREYYAESNSELAKKLSHCQQYQMGTILCIGESESVYEAGETKAVLTEQIQAIALYLQDDSALETDNGSISEEVIKQLTSKLIIAYEPVWAIGTGKVPTVEEVTAIHTHIRQVLKNIHNDLQHIPVIYGGSVKPDNAEAFASSHEINGVLVGGAALDADSFIAIAQAFVANPNK
ncbi:triose-phosphate isomerase [Psychrobacter sp. I-STPA6b]|uniref:triose-phosphate isomerase n=1 Tax=Psychrobacter sp. I-STPA6b TaxID=2585718 RepID=UPI001D0C7FA1|nr:triose-phosphate isomerase [Psychrobacter sp. I-STPA6b]